ncbi:MAG TPA: hypothetical protein VNO86_03160 [Candidatus Binatia bacterium]|nr:hypothetical protein [Candidatus Binatia bacterium]
MNRDWWGWPDPASLHNRRCAVCGTPLAGRTRILVRRAGDGERLRLLCRPDERWGCFRYGTAPAAIEAIALEVPALEGGLPEVEVVR